MTADVRSLVMLPGRCSACKQPAEQHVGSRRWWHAGEVCEWRNATMFRPVEIHPIKGGGFEVGPLSVDLPARFIPHNGGPQ